MEKADLRKDLFVNIEKNDIEIALQENGALVEFHREKTNNDFAVGDIYIGRVKRILSGLNAAFVDIGHSKDAFLHYSDLGRQINTTTKFVKSRLQHNKKQAQSEKVRIEQSTNKQGNIKNVLAINQLVLVQIIKESISTKGPRVSGEISFAGRYLVLMPFLDQVMISQKIRNDKERSRLRHYIQENKPKNTGIIIRTVAENKSEEDLRVDMEQLLSRWNEATANINGTKFPKKISSESDIVISTLRDMLDDNFNSIYVNDEEKYEEIRSLLKIISPNQLGIVKYYKKQVPMFETFGVSKQIKSGFGKIVAIRNGIYLIIEHTEALHVIDVNSGHRMDALKTQEENVLSVNLEAAVEIARQLRLRDIGGIIIVDFIDMRTSEHRKALFNMLKDEMKKDRACHTILPPNKFGLVQITRQRVRPATDIDVLEKCPSCQGVGNIKAPILFIDEIENNLQFLTEKQHLKKIILETHPFVYAYLKEGFISLRIKWMLKYKFRLKLKKNPRYHFLEYHLFDSTLGEIKLWTSPKDSLEVE